MFKVGDRVRCMDDSGAKHRLIKNNIYTVTSVTDAFVRLNNENIGWYPYRFALVKEEEVKLLDLSKKYVDRYNNEVELFAHKDGRYWGRSKIVSGWTEGSWSEYNHGLSVKKEKIKREYWLVHHVNGENSAYTTEKAANYWEKHPHILAITGPHTVEFEVEEK